MSEKQFLYFALGVMMVVSVSGAWAGDGVVALQTAAASCPDDSDDRYVDCGKGTVTDNDTGLVWLKQANCLAKCSGSDAPCTVDSDCPPTQTCDATEVDWFTAMEFVAGLSDKPAGSAAANQDCGLSDGSSPGEWRLPSVEEWEAMVADAVDMSCGTTITNDFETGCWDSACVTAGACSFSGVQSDFYWSSTTTVPGFVVNTSSAWSVNLDGGDVYDGAYKTFSGNHVWPVRGGQ